MFDISIVITTVCRRSLLRSVISIFNQQFNGKIQILIGVDIDLYNLENSLKEAIEKECPEFVQVNWINIGYSTSERHGGVHKCHYGGSLRTSLSFLAASKYVMYLDDDDWLAHNHCQTIFNAIYGKKWAFSYSIYADGNKSTGICIDYLESVGVDKGIYAETFGGFVRPSGLVIDKTQMGNILHMWSQSPFPTGDGEDRLFFNELKSFDSNEYACTEIASVFYTIDPKDDMHESRLNYFKSLNINWQFEEKNESVR